MHSCVVHITTVALCFHVVVKLNFQNNSILPSFIRKNMLTKPCKYCNQNLR